MHRPHIWHAGSSTHTFIHAYLYMFRERWRDRQSRQKQCNTGTSSAAGSDIDKKTVLLHRYVSTDSLSSQVSSSLASKHRTSSVTSVKPQSSSCLCFSTAAPAHSDWLQPILIPKDEDKEGDGRCRETRIDGGRRRVRRKKEEKETCQWEAGLRKNLPANWPDSFHNPAAAPICCCWYYNGAPVHL